MSIKNYTIFKEYCPYAKKAVIRTDSYGHNIEFFLNLVEIAKQDFAIVDDKMIDVMRYTSPRAGYGIEFEVFVEPDESYIRISNLPMTK